MGIHPASIYGIYDHLRRPWMTWAQASMQDTIAAREAGTLKWDSAVTEFGNPTLVARTAVGVFQLWVLCSCWVVVIYILQTEEGLALPEAGDEKRTV
jgi:hypothetical protein